MSLGIVYYMRLDHPYRKKYEDKLDKEVYVQDEVVFSHVRVIPCQINTKNIPDPHGFG